MEFDIVLNVSLLFIACFAAVVAIGGDTWDKTNPRLWKRITKRGWVAITCALLTLVIGTTKEVHSSYIKSDIRKSAEMKQKELKDEIGTLQRKIGALKDELAATTGVIDDFHKYQVTREADAKRRADMHVDFQFAPEHESFAERYIAQLIADGYKPSSHKNENLPEGIIVSYSKELETEAFGFAVPIRREVGWTFPINFREKSGRLAFLNGIDIAMGKTPPRRLSPH